MASGRSAFSLAHGTGMFDFLAENPDDAQWFNDMMIGFHGAEPGAVAKVYDCTGIERLVDGGGGTGNMSVDRAGWTEPFLDSPGQYFAPGATSGRYSARKEISGSTLLALRAGM